MKIKTIKTVKTNIPIKFYDITVKDYQNFSIGNSNIIAHNSSLEKAVNKLARSFGNAMSILEGDGFFGTESSPSPAAARYTSVKLSSVVHNIINKYNYLTTREPEGPYDPLWLDLPIGLVSPIVGLSVGYKTTILPRKLKDIEDFLAGKIKHLKPYFEGFGGKIEKYNSIDKSWIISSTIGVEDKRVLIRDIPPILKYDTVLKKLDYLINKFESNIRIVNNSKIKVNIDIVYTGKDENEFNDIVNFITKTFSIIVTESPVFVKDGNVLTYDSIEQYLEDYRWQIIRLKFKNIQYERNKLSFDSEFNHAKEKFILFMISKKRTNEEIDTFLAAYSKEIGERLERMTARKFTADELELTKQTIKELEKELKQKEKELIDAESAFNKYPDPTLKRGIANKKNVVNLFETEDISIIDDVVIWDGNDVYDGEEKEKILEENEE